MILTVIASTGYACRAGAELVLEDIVLDEPASSIDVPAPATGRGDVGTGTEQDRVLFLNRDRLHGEVVDVVPAAHGLRWTHSDVQESIDFKLENVRHIELGNREKRKHRAHKSSVKLTNDDLLLGDIVSMGGASLVLDTWYAGTVTIARPMIKAIKPTEGESAKIFEGPTDIANWTTDEGGWVLEKGALHARGHESIGRNLPELPDKFEMRFKLRWSGRPQLYFSFLTDEVRYYHGQGYSLQVGGSTVTLSRRSSRSSRSIGSAQVESLQHLSTSSATFTLYVDPEAAAFTLFIDDKMVQQWTDSQGFAGAGNGIVFYPQSGGGLSVSDIAVLAWDGTLPMKAGEDAGEEAQDTIRLVNGDKMSGEVLQIADGAIAFKTDYATLSVPLARAEEILMSTARTERARRNKGDVRSHFMEKGVVTLDLQKIEGGKIEGTSENLGHVRVPLAALGRIEFSIYRSRESDSEKEL